MRNLPIWFQRVEAAALFAAMTALYLIFHSSIWLYIVLFLSIDLSILGYLAGPRVGAIIYNSFHSLTLPFLCAALGLLSTHLVWLDALAMVWLAHIGFDRMLGLGLKYPDRFKHTHLSRS
jgi:uncharacterized protein DUF4260